MCVCVAVGRWERRPSVLAYYVRRRRAFTHIHTHNLIQYTLRLVDGVRKDGARLIVDFVFTHCVLFDGCFEGISHLDIISGGKQEHGERDGGKGRAAARRDDTADG